MLDRGIDTRAEVRTLSVAQMQIVEIAKALSLEAKILLMDEPTASITEHETAALFTLLKRLRDDGVAIVFVSHKLEEVFAIADRVTVLRDGKNAAIGEPMATMTRDRLVSLMIGREERVAVLGERQPDMADVVLEATRAGHRRSAIATSTSPSIAARSSASTGWSAPGGASLPTPSSAAPRSPPASCACTASRCASATCTRR